MPGRLDSCTKIFVGNFTPGTPIDEIRQLFAKYGEVVECDIVRNFCFVHMSDEKEAHSAIAALNGFTLGGRRLNVEESTSEVRQKPGMGGTDKCFFCGDGGHWSRDCPKRGSGGRSQGGRSAKIYVGNVTEDTTDKEIRDMFSKYGTVTECAKVKNYAFVHMKTFEEAEDAIEHLKGFVLNGNTLTIEASTSRPRGKPPSSPTDRYSSRSSGGWEGSRSSRSERVSSSMRSVDPYAMSPSSVAAMRSMYARERVAPYPSPAYIARYDERYLDRDRYERARALAMMDSLYDRRAAAAAAAAAASPSSSSSAARAAYDRYAAAYSSSAATAADYDRLVDRYAAAAGAASSSSSSRDPYYSSSSSAAGGSSASRASAADYASYYAARGYPTAAASSSGVASSSSSRGYDYSRY